MGVIASAWRNELRQWSHKPLRALLLLLQLILAVVVAAVALHALEAERSQRHSREVFSLNVDTMGQQVVEVQMPFTMRHLVELQALAPEVEALALHSQHLYRPQAVFGGEHFKFKAIGQVSEGYPELLAIEFIQGSMFTADEISANKAVMVLEEDVAEFIFGEINPLGQELLMFPGHKRHERRYVVIGVYRYNAGFERKENGPLGRYSALVPSHPSGSSNLVVSAKPGSGGAAREQILVAVRNTFPGLLGSGDGTDAFIEELDRPFNAFGVMDANLLLFALIGITALVLAAVGIFSATVVDVSEQTHAIGVRRALGASGWRIAGEFMAGAGLLALTGGVIGFALAWFVIPLLASRAGASLFPGITITFNFGLGLTAVLLVTLFSGVLGFLPALRVGRMTPTSALNEV